MKTSAHKISWILFSELMVSHFLINEKKKIFSWNLFFNQISSGKHRRESNLDQTSKMDQQKNKVYSCRSGLS